MAAQPNDDPPLVGEHVAAIEIELPMQETFTLRATLPVPAGVHFEDDPTEPLSIIAADGTRFPTQVERLSRYADAARDGSDVVELFARVQRPEGSQPGHRVRFDVQYFPHARGSFDSTPHADQMFRRPRSLMMRTWDVFGHEYELDLLEDIRTQNADMQRTHRGELVRGWATHGVLRAKNPTGGASGTLPHMMGAHAFVRQYASEHFLTLDLRIHNGMSGLDTGTNADNALRDLYFERLDIDVPLGWKLLSAVVDPYLGTSFYNPPYRTTSLIEPETGGRMHLFRQQGQIFRRLVLVRNGYEDRAMAELRSHFLGFCVSGLAPETSRQLWSWWSPRTARYCAQNHRLPSLAHLDLGPFYDRMEDDLAFFAGHVANGTGLNGAYPLITEAAGYIRPYGTPYGGMAGGVEIDLFGGVELAALGSREGYRLAQLLSRMYIDRQPTALYNLDGNPTRLVDWLRTNGQGQQYFPGYFNHVPLLPHNDPFGFMDAPTFQTDYVLANGLEPTYQDLMLSYHPIDIQHWARMTRLLKQLAWLGGDRLAMSEIEASAELFRLSYHEFPSSAAGHVASWGLRGSQDAVAENPAQGFGFGRAAGWGLDMAACAYALGDDSLRERFYPWFELIADLVQDGQSDCGGNLQAQPHHSNGGQYRIWQCFEAAIGENALRGIDFTAFVGRDDARHNQIVRVMVRQAYGTISSAFWTPGQDAPHGTVAVGPHDTDLPPYCGDALDEWASNELDTKYYWNTLAYAFEATRDSAFMDAATEMSGTGNLFNFMHNNAHADIENRGMMLALLQQMNGIF